MKRLVKDSISGVLLGGWIVLHLWFLAYYFASTVLLPRGLPVTKHNIAFLVNKTNPNMIVILTGISAVIIIIGIMLSIGWFCFDRKYICDPGNLLKNSTRWTLRVISKPITALCLLLPIIITGFGFNSNIELLQLAIVCSSLLIVIILPFSILRDPVFRSDTGNNWWVPKWPGGWTVISLLLLSISSILLEIILTRIEFTIIDVNIIWFKLLAIPALILDIILSIVYTSWQSAILIHKLSPKAAIKFIKHSMKWQLIGPTIALTAKLIYFITCIIVPIVSIGLLLNFVLPSYARVYMDHGLDLPIFVQYLVSGANFLKRAPFTYCIPLEAISFLLIGRLVWLLDYQPWDEQASNHGVDHDAENSSTQVTP